MVAIVSIKTIGTRTTTTIIRSSAAIIVCQSREACDGPAAIPMNRPGYWYLPGGMFMLHRFAPGPDAPYAAYHPRYHYHKHPLNH
jgi:hypothetical protein